MSVNSCYSDKIAKRNMYIFTWHDYTPVLLCTCCFSYLIVCHHNFERLQAFQKPVQGVTVCFTLLSVTSCRSQQMHVVNHQGTKQLCWWHVCEKLIAEAFHDCSLAFSIFFGGKLLEAIKNLIWPPQERNLPIIFSLLLPSILWVTLIKYKHL